MSTQQCAIFGGFGAPDSETVLLRADSEAIAHGAVFFQSLSDVLEVDQFTAVGNPTNSSHRRPDVRLQWVNLWGENHARGVSGPRVGGGGSGVKLLARPRPGAVEPGDLAIDPSTLSGRRSMDLGADLTRIGIAPTGRGGPG